MTNTLRAQTGFSNTSEHHGYVYTTLKTRVLRMGCQLLALIVSHLKIFARHLWWFYAILPTSETGPAQGMISCLAPVCSHALGGGQCPGPGLSSAAPWLSWSRLGQWNDFWLPEPALISLKSPYCSWPQGATGLCCSLTYFILLYKIKIQPRSCLDQRFVSEVID